MQSLHTLCPKEHLTQRCLGQRSYWLSAVQGRQYIDSALSRTENILNQRSPVKSSVWLSAVRDSMESSKYLCQSTVHLLTSNIKFPYICNFSSSAALKSKNTSGKIIFVFWTIHLFRYLSVISGQPDKQKFQRSLS